MDYKIVCLLALMVASAVCYDSQDQPWQSNCACARVYMPICASDGHTYNNKCLFDCKATALREKGHVLSIVKINKRCDGSE